MAIAIIVESKDAPMREVRIGIIGCGGIASGKHLISLKKLPNVKLVAFCDMDIERAAQACREYGEPDAQVYTDYKELLAREDIEVVHVLTPNSSHCPISVDALKAGKHVMCEKPMATTYAEARLMADTAKECGKFLTVGYQFRYAQAYQYVRHLVENGELGEIYYVKAPCIRRRGVPLWGSFLNKEKQGGGPLIDIGTHAIDSALAMMGNYDVVSVTGSVYRKLADTAMNTNEWGIWEPRDFKVEDAAMGYVKFRNGATMVVEASWLLNHVGDSYITLYGTKGGAQIIDEDTVRLNGEKDGGLFTADIKPGPAARDLFHGQHLSVEDYEAKQWIYSIVNNVPPLVKPEQACVVSQIIEAIYESAETGKTVYFT